MNPKTFPCLGLLFLFAAFPQPVGATEGAFYDQRGQPGSNADGRWESLWNRAFAEVDEQRYDQAIRSLDLALESGPPPSALAGIYLLRGNALFRKGERTRARADYERTVRFPVKTADDYAVRAGAWEKLGNFQSSAADYVRASALAPDRFEALNRLAWFRATCPEAAYRNGREALELANKACSWTHWHNADVIDTLAAAEAEIGDFERAVLHEEQAIKKTERSQRRALEERLALYRARKPFRDIPKSPAG